MGRRIGTVLLLIGGGYLAALGITAAAIIMFIVMVAFNTVGAEATINPIVDRVGAVTPLIGLTVLLAVALGIIGLVLGGLPAWAGRGPVTRR